MFRSTLILVIACLWSVVHGQNPFELSDRLDSTAMEQIQPVETVQDNSNPFEKNSTAQVQKEQELETPALPDIKTEATLRGSTWFWILLFLTLLVAIVINLNRSIIPNLAKAWSNANFSNLLLRDKKATDQIQYYFLEAIYYINLACLAVFGLDHLYGIPPSFSSLVVYLAIIVGIYLVRYLTLAILSRTYSVSKEASQYSFTINQFNMTNGLILLVLNYFIAFGPDGLAKTLVIVALLIVLLQYVYRSIRGLLLSARFIFNDQIHFFLYLCTCEIMPWLVGTVYLSEIS